MTPAIGDPPKTPARLSHRHLAIATALGIIAVAIIIAIPPGWRPRPTIGEAGFDSTEYIVIGGSRVADQGAAQFKESLLRIEGGDLVGTGSIVRIAQQQQGQPLDCLDERYAGDRYWTSSTPSTGRIEFRNATTFEVVGTVVLTVTVDEVVPRALAGDPVCQAITGTYRGLDGELSGIAGSVLAGFAPGRIAQFWYFDDNG